MRTNDPVVLSVAEFRLREAGIDCLIADQNMSVLDGSVGILPRRLLVLDEDEEEARSVLTEAKLGHELR